MALKHSCKRNVLSFLYLVGTGFGGREHLSEGRACKGNIRTPRVTLQLLRRMCACAVDISRLVNRTLKYFLGIFKKCHIRHTADKLWCSIFLWCVCKMTVALKDLLKA